MKRTKYLLYDGDELLGEYTVKELSEITGCSGSTARTYVDTGFKYKNRYVFESGVETILFTKKEAERFTEQWNKIRKHLLRR